jgi:twitching motility protein PilT
MNLHMLLEGMRKVSASDLHLKPGSPPMLRVNRSLKVLSNQPPLQEADTEGIAEALIPDYLKEDFQVSGAADFSYALPNIGRFRVAVFRQRGMISFAFRHIGAVPPEMEQLHLPDVVATFAEYSDGLVLVTGVTGSGKSSTLAAIIQRINMTRRAHIVTLEDPIEYQYTDAHSIVNQIEVGRDTPSFSEAMHRILRVDPNIIMIGEMRNRETVETALEAVDTGHMVLSTLHTSDSKQTINRILHFFTKEEESLILELLSLNLRAIISQRLLPRNDIEGMIPACEVLINSPIVSKLIREARVPEIEQVLKNRESGMQSFDNSLADLVRTSKITLELGLHYASDEAGLRRMIRGESAGGDRSSLIGGRDK